MIASILLVVALLIFVIFLFTPSIKDFFIGITALSMLLFWGGLIYIIMHFVIKFW